MSEYFGDVAALAFSAPAWRLGARDSWIGWDEASRAAQLDRLVCNSRLLIRPHWRIPGLASHVLARDWRRRLGAPGQPPRTPDADDGARTSSRRGAWAIGGCNNG